MTHTLSRTMQWLRDQGYIVGKTELPWNQWSRKRSDLFGFIDCIAIKGKDTFGVQACGSDFAAHERKIRASEHFHDWLDGGTRKIMLVGWTQKVHRNKDGTKSKVKRWTPKTLLIDSTALDVVP